MPTAPTTFSMPQGESVVVWTDATHESDGMRLALRMGDGVELKAVCGPGRASSRAGERTVVPLGLRGSDDLRAMVMAHKPRYVLALTSEGMHPEHLPWIEGKPVVILSREPVPNQPAGKPGEGAQVLLWGAFLGMPGLLAAQEAARTIGSQRAVGVVSTGIRAEASLFARLLDAWDAALAFAPLPESIHAALLGPVGPAPSTPEGLTGRLTAHGIVSGEGGITLLCADSGPEHRTLDVVAQAGTLSVTPALCQSGQAEARLEAAAACAIHQPSRDDALLAQWRNLLGPKPLTPRSPSPEAMACCAACLLSIRTGSAENPRRILSLGSDLFSPGEMYPLFA